MKLCAVSDSLGNLPLHEAAKASADLGLAALEIGMGNWSFGLAMEREATALLGEACVFRQKLGYQEALHRTAPHQDVEDLAIMRVMPDMTVLAPADAIEGEAIIRWATEFDGPVYLRLARDACPNVFDQQYQFVPGRTISLREGKDVLLVSTGPQSVCCLEAAELLQAQGISAGVLHLPSIKPLNKEEVVNAAEKTKLVVNKYAELLAAK